MTVNSIVKVSLQGVSRPYVCLGDDGFAYWCKGHHTGFRALMLEWLCAGIAHAVGLPVPECHIAKLNFRIFTAWRDNAGESCPVIVTETNQYVFASRHVESAKDVIDVENDLRDADPNLLAKIYIFDRFIRNTDRTDVNSNLLVNGGIHVIDHNNALDTGFDEESFSQTHVLRDFHALMPQDDRRRFEQKIRATVTPEFLDAVWSEMPADWTDPGASVLSLDDVKDILLEGGR